MDFSEYTPNRIPGSAHDVLRWKGHVVKVVLKPHVIQTKGRVLHIIGDYMVCVEINGQRKTVQSHEIRLPANMKRPPRVRKSYKKGKKGLMRRVRAGIRWIMLLLG